MKEKSKVHSLSFTQINAPLIVSILQFKQKIFTHTLL